MIHDTQAAILSQYQSLIASSESNIVEYKRQSNRFSLIRLAVFLLAIPGLYFVIKTSWMFLILFLLAFVALFVWAVIQQQKYDRLLSDAEAMLSINQNEVSAIQRQQNLYFDGADYEIPGHLYTGDLDVFGPHSMYALLNRCKTYDGNQFLKESFLVKPTKQEVALRQEAVKELSPELEWRQKVQTKLFALEGAETYDVASAIKEQMNMDLGFATGSILTIYRKILPILWLGIIGLYFYNAAMANTLAPFLFIGNLLLVGRATKQVSEVQGRLANSNRSIKQFIEVLDVVFSKTWKSTHITERSAMLDKSDTDVPIDSLAQLSKIIDHLDYRLNLLVAIVANGLVVWDLSVVARLAKWQERYHGQIDQVFAYVGYIEAMNSLATWSYNQPQYDYPTLVDAYMEISSSDLEHPLIPHDQNVANDFQLQKQDKVVIITGSNMSGKSTFLRTLGLNMILGYTGTKVAASMLQTPIVSVVTYMRIKDALEENVSTFKAELNRIELILQILETESDAFILIDEMLRGTNSKDKLNGSIGITRKLLESHAYAMIATHDIKLAELGTEESQIANYYFDIDYHEGELVFDYKIKKGICENFNASFLLGQLGIST